MKSDLKLVVFSQVVKAGKACKISVSKNNGALARIVTERNQDDSMLEGILLVIEPERGLIADLVLFIEYPEFMTGRSNFFK